MEGPETPVPLYSAHPRRNAVHIQLEFHVGNVVEGSIIVRAYIASIHKRFILEQFRKKQTPKSKIHLLSMLYVETGRRRWPLQPGTHNTVYSLDCKFKTQHTLRLVRTGHRFSIMNAESRREDDLTALHPPGTAPSTEIAMNWLILTVAGLFEIAWAIGLKYTDGFSRLWPSVATVLAMAASFMLLAAAMKTLPVATAYAVWVGIGAVGTAALGILLFDDPAGPMRLLSLALICIGIAGLKLTQT